jgi:hypothetical protein
MNMPTREMKWGAGGFLGGFLLCYLLIGGLLSQPPASPLVARMTPTTAWPAVAAVPGVQVTNFPLPELRIESPPRWLGPGLPPGPPHPGYSLDLIDTHAEAPKLPQNP